MAKSQMTKKKKLVAIVMGSTSDWSIMQQAVLVCREFDVACETNVLSAHRTPDELEQWVAQMEKKGTVAFIAGAGGAAHLAGVVASRTVLPVLGVPIPSPYLKGMDSLLSTVQMPRGIPVCTFAIGEAGATNAALAAIEMMAVYDGTLRRKLIAYRKRQANKVLSSQLPVIE